MGSGSLGHGPTSPTSAFNLYPHNQYPLLFLSSLFETQTFALGLNERFSPSYHWKAMYLRALNALWISASLIFLSFKCTRSTRFKRTDISGVLLRTKFGMKSGILSLLSTRHFASSFPIKLSQAQHPRLIVPATSWPKSNLWHKLCTLIRHPPKSTQKDLVQENAFCLACWPVSSEHWGVALTMKYLLAMLNLTQLFSPTMV